MERIIKVTGRGKISVKPDTIQLNINAEGIYKEYAEAVRRSTEDTALIRETIAKAGLDPKDLKTVYFGVDTEYENYQDRHGNWKQRFKGYKYSHSMHLKFPADNEVLGKVLYELANCKVSVQFSISHTVKDVEAVKNELLGKAVTDSRTKAQVLTEAAGVTLGDIVNIDYSWGELEIYSRPMRNLAFGSAINAKEDSAFDLDIEAEDIDVQDTVTVVWEIK